MARPVRDGMSLLIGAGIGVGLMYLLDPEVGAQRRRMINKQAQKNLSKVRGYASDLASSGMEHLHDVADMLPSKSESKSKLAGLGSYLSPAVGAVTDAYHHLGEQLHGHLSQASDTASDAAGSAKSAGAAAASSARAQLHALKDQLSEQLSNGADKLSLPDKAKYSKLLRDTTLALGRDEDHHYASTTACALGSLAIGAGFVYFLDSDKGHVRRDNVASAVTTSVHEIGQFFRRVGSSVVQRGQRVVDQAQDQFADVTQKAAEIRDNYMGGSSGEARSEYSDSASASPSMPSY